MHCITIQRTEYLSGSEQAGRGFDGSEINGGRISRWWRIARVCACSFDSTRPSPDWMGETHLPSQDGRDPIPPALITPDESLPPILSSVLAILPGSPSLSTYDTSIIENFLPHSSVSERMIIICWRLTSLLPRIQPTARQVPSMTPSMAWHHQITSPPAPPMIRSSKNFPTSSPNLQDFQIRLLAGGC